MDAKFTGEGTSVHVEFGETHGQLAGEKISSAPAPKGQKYNPREGKLPLAYWAANKDVPLHWHQAVKAHLQIDHAHELSEADFDKALLEVQNLKLG